MNNQQSLVAAAQAGNREAFAKLYDAHVREIYDFVYFRTHHTETAQDLVSQTFLRALNSIDRYDETKASFRTWLYRIARNAVIDHYRSMKLTADIADAWDIASTQDVERDAHTALTLAELQKHMAKLTPTQRDVLTMRLWDQKTHAEIAEILDISVDNSKMSFSRGLQKLRAEMPLAAFIAFLTLGPLV